MSPIRARRGVSPSRTTLCTFGGEVDRVDPRAALAVPDGVQHRPAVARRDRADVGRLAGGVVGVG